MSTTKTLLKKAANSLSEIKIKELSAIPAATIVSAIKISEIAEDTSKILSGKKFYSTEKRTPTYGRATRKPNHSIILDNRISKNVRDKLSSKSRSEISGQIRRRLTSVISREERQKKKLNRLLVSRGADEALLNSLERELDREAARNRND